MAHHNFNWTPERVADAQRLRDLGISGREIAERFGVSRSAVLGMFKREKDKAQPPQAEVAPE